ncbi:hypothetical protein BJ741DRAFT_557801 [Chytriomyces cf. hyalinus JEL632]|nr:hypothetical protein BJ741DRAFT_557801 [Chytriomyces cf. hyalinus JEL632]
MTDPEPPSSQPAPAANPNPSSPNTDHHLSEQHGDSELDLPPVRTSVPYSTAQIYDRRVNLRHRNLPSVGASNSAATPDTGPAPKPDTNSNTKGKEPATETGTKSDTKQGAGGVEEEGGLFECNICLDMASNPVVTMCGHLFCWPCVHRWITSSNRHSNACPVCKAGIDKDKLIPIYAKGRTQDPRNIIPEEPERPAGQRSEPAPQPGAFNFNPFFSGLPGAQFNVGGTNIHFSAGFGPLGLLFPLLGYGIQHLAGVGAGNGARGAGIGAMGTPNDERMARVVAQQAFISRLFMLISALVFVAILLY